MVTVTFDVRSFGNLADVYGDISKRTPAALARALNWTGDKARTTATRILAQVAGLSYGRTRKEIKTKRAQRYDLEYDISVSGMPFSLQAFGAHQTARGVSAAPWGQRRIFPHTFIVAKLGGQVFVREGSARMPIRKLWGPSLPKEFVRDVVPKAFIATAEDEFAGRVLHEVERLFPVK